MIESIFSKKVVVDFSMHEKRSWPTENTFFKIEAMLISTLSSGPCKLAMKGYTVSRSMDKIYKSNSLFNMVLEKINEIKQAFKQK